MHVQKLPQSERETMAIYSRIDSKRRSVGRRKDEQLARGATAAVQLLQQAICIVQLICIVMN